MDAERALRVAARASGDPAGAVARWRALTGRKAVGCLEPCVVEEVVHAGGMLPVTAREVSVDGWVLPPRGQGGEEAAHRLGEKDDPRRLFFLPWRPTGCDDVPDPADVVDCVEALCEWVERTSGWTVSRGGVERSIRLHHENRRIATAIGLRMTREAGVYTGAEFLSVFRAGAVWPAEAHSRVLTAALRRKAAPAGPFAAKVFVAGNLPGPALADALDRAAAAITGIEGLGAGRYRDEGPPEGGDPVVALARRLGALARPADTPAARAARIVDRAATSGADRLVYVTAPGRTGPGHEASVVAREARARGIPVLVVDPPGGPGAPADTGARIALFIEKGEDAP